MNGGQGDPGAFPGPWMSLWSVTTPSVLRKLKNKGDILSQRTLFDNYLSLPEKGHGPVRDDDTDVSRPDYSGPDRYMSKGPGKRLRTHTPRSGGTCC